MGAPLTIEKILARRVDRSGGPDSCWIWVGYRDRHGYGEYSSKRAHRVVYEALAGPIPDGLDLDHLCCNPPCVNPSHLEPVPHAVNMRRAADRIMECPAGHAYDADNTYVNRRGRRICRACNRDRQRQRVRRAA